MCRSRRELSNEYLLAKIGVDTAENEPLEVWGENSIQYSLHSLLVAPEGEVLGVELPAYLPVLLLLHQRPEPLPAQDGSGVANFTGLVLGCIEAKFCKLICV